MLVRLVLVRDESGCTASEIPLQPLVHHWHSRGGRRHGRRRALGALLSSRPRSAFPQNIQILQMGDIIEEASEAERGDSRFQSCLCRPGPRGRACRNTCITYRNQGESESYVPLVIREYRLDV
jgi:hypothetical protein